jgi:hypothetical protein
MTADAFPIADLLEKADEVAASIGYPDGSLRAEYHRQFVMLLSQAYVQVFGTRIENPDWVPHTGPLFPWGAPNHDTIYGFAPLDGAGVYRISGLQGSETIASLMFRRGGANTGEVHGATLGEIDVQALAADESGRFDLVLSRQRPDGVSGDWHPIPDGTTGLLARHVTEVPSQIDGCWTIERLDRGAVQAVRSAAQIDDRMAAMLSFTLKLNGLLLRLVKKLQDAGAVNRFLPERWQGNGGIALQMYFHTLYEIADDEALIVESELPGAVLYWSVQLIDAFYGGIDFIFHCAARNQRQCTPDADGRVRFVVALQDPEVPNWLDPAGWRRGGIVWRWHSASSIPEPSVRKVKLSQLRSSLPADTPRVDRASRAHEIAARIRHYQSRRRW